MIRPAPVARFTISPAWWLAAVSLSLLVYWAAIKIGGALIDWIWGAL